MVEHLDLDTVIKVSQAVSGEIVREKVIDTLMRTAVEHSGAERGLLILPRGVDQCIEAEATIGKETITVNLPQVSVTATDLPASLLHYVVRTQESVVLDDASALNPFSSDDYICQNHARSVLCLPLVKQAKLIGVLYLENNLTSHVFTPARIGVLKVLVSQAAISLENANLYSDLQRSEAAIRASEKSLRLIVDTIPGFVCTLNAAGEVELLNRQVLDYFGKTTEELKNWATSDAVHPDDLPRVIDAWRRSVETGQPYEVEHRLRRADGAYRWFQSRALPARDAEGRITGWYGVLTDNDDRRRAEDALRASEQDFRLIVDTIPGLVWTMTAAGEVELINQQMLDYFGKTPDELKEWSRFLHPDDRDRVVSNWQAALATREPLEMEARYQRADGLYRWFLVRKVPLRDEKGNIVKWYSTTFDIEDRKQAEENLRRSEAYLAEAQKLTHTGSWAVNVATGERSHSSAEHFRLFGFDPERGVPSGKELLQRIHPEDRDRTRETFERAVGERADVEVDYRAVLPDGTIKFLRSVGHPVFTAAGDLVEYIGTTMDVTEHKLAEEALRQREKELREVQDLAQLGSWQWDPDLDVVTWSEEMYRIFGRAPDLPAPSRKEQAQLFTPESWERSQRAVNAALRDGTPYALVDLEMVLSDGTTGWVSARGEVQHDDAGRIVRLRGTLMDITERKRAEEALQKAQAELAHVTRVATLGAMTASISHEINQPLGAIVNNANACLRWLASSKLEEARQSAILIAADGHRASEIIARIRALAQKAPTRKDWFDVNESIHEVIALARSEVQGNRVSLKTQLGGDLPPILGDRIQLQQVLLNLIMNAIEAMRGVDEGPRELWVDSKRVESREVLIAVRDSGPGLDAKSLDHLFEAFYTTKPEGLGMGLAISRSIIEAHGGRLWATANAPRGAVFQFTLPTGGERPS